MLLQYKKLENYFYIYTIWHYLFAFLPTFSLAIYGSMDIVSKMLILSSLFIYSGFALIIIAYKLPLKNYLRNNYLLAIFLIFITFSFLWSIEPLHTLNRSIALIASTLCAFTLAYRLNIKKFLVLLNKAIYITALLSIISYFIIPNVIIHIGDIHQGDWRGVFYMKNALGRAMMLGIVVTVLLCIYKDRIVINDVNKLIIYCVLLILSKSSTAIFITVFFLLLTPLVYLYYNNKINKKYFSKAVILFVLLLSIIIITNLEMILYYLGRNLTLTGRTTLWIGLLNEFINHNIYLGFGYAAYFDSTSVSQFTGRWEATHPHSGYIGLLLDTGLIGFSLFFLLLWKYYSDVTYSIKFNKNYVFHYVFIFIFLIRNIPGTDMVNHHSLYWIIFIYLYSTKKNFKIK